MTRMIELPNGRPARAGNPIDRAVGDELAARRTQGLPPFGPGPGTSGSLAVVLKPEAAQHVTTLMNQREAIALNYRDKDAERMIAYYAQEGINRIITQNLLALAEEGLSPEQVAALRDPALQSRMDWDASSGTITIIYGEGDPPPVHAPSVPD